MTPPQVRRQSEEGVALMFHREAPAVVALLPAAAVGGHGVAVALGLPAVPVVRQPRGHHRRLEAEEAVNEAGERSAGHRSPPRRSSRDATAAAQPATLHRRVQSPSRR